MKFILALTTTLLFTGCSSLQVCDNTEIQRLVTENAKLLGRKKTIEGYENGVPIPGSLFSLYMKHELIYIYKASHDKAVDRLMYDAENCRVKQALSN